MKPDQTPTPYTEDSQWSWLYRLGGAAAMIMAILIPIQIVVFIASPPPGTVSEYFTLFQHNKLLGLLDLDLLLIVDNILALLLTLAFFAALRRTNPAFMTIALTCGMVSIVLFLVSREATFSMMTLSDQYASAATDAQRQVFLAAGQIMLTLYNGTVFNVSYILGAVYLIIISGVMLQTHIFSKAVAWLGLVANVMAFGLYIPQVGVFISIFSVMFLWVWDILVALRLLQLGNANPMKRSLPS